MAASLFGGKKGDSVAALQPVPTVPKEVVVPQTDLFIVDEEPEDYTSRRRGTFSPDPPVSSTNKTDRHDRTEILLKVVLKQTNKQTYR
jgi:hypothetical protein